MLTHPIRIRLTVVALLQFSVWAQHLAAQPVDVVGTAGRPNLVAAEGTTPRGDAAPLPSSRFSVSRGIGIVEDDGDSYWPGFPADLQVPSTFHVTPTSNNTFLVQKVPFQFDDPTTAVVLFDGATRPIVGYLDANYIRPLYTLASPFPFGGKSYTTLSISTWGAVAFGDADSTQVNYDPTVVSSMFHIPMVAVWYELFYYPSDARVVAKAKPGSVVITWQNVLSRHSSTRCTFQVEFFLSTGEMQFSYRTLPVADGLVGFSTGTETVTRQNANGLTVSDIPAYMQVTQAAFEDYGGIIAGVNVTLGAPIPVPTPSNASLRYTLVLNGTEVVGAQVSGSQSPFIVVSSPKIPAFPAAQIDSWETKLTGTTLSFRVPASSLEPYLSTTSTNTWTIKSARFGGDGFVERIVTQTLPLSLTVRHSFLPQSIGTSTEMPAEVFHYMPGVWDTDRIRESIAAYLATRVPNADSFRFFPTIYDDGLRHSNYAGTYPRQKSTGGVGQIPARTECDCHYGAEFSSVAESLADETTTQVALTHELAHEYVLYADYRAADGTVKGAWRDAGVPCFGGAHPNGGLVNPSMFSDSEATAQTISVMGGSVTGTYQLNAPRFGLSRLDMYLMGLATPAEVTPLTFVQNGTSSQITIDQVISANGPRTPNYSGQMRVFRVPAFIVKRKSEVVSDAQLAQLQALLWKWQSRFWRETGGRARVNPTLDGGCSFTLSATTAKAGRSSIKESVSVFAESGCSWTASTSASWITLTGSGGSGDGKVSYVVATNLTGAARTDTITIAGQPFTVNQLSTPIRRRSVRR